MPQFNPESFASQLFWLAICFSVLYMCASKIFLPRIKEILATRAHDVDHNLSLAAEINEQIEEIQMTSKHLRETANTNYKLSIDNAVKQVNLKREEDLHNLRTQISKMIEHSSSEIAEFKNKSQNESQKTVDFLVNEIGNKFLK